MIHIVAHHFHIGFDLLHQTVELRDDTLITNLYRVGLLLEDLGAVCASHSVLQLFQVSLILQH